MAEDVAPQDSDVIITTKEARDWHHVFGRVEFIVKMLTFLVVCLVVLVIGLAVQVQNRNKQIDELGLAINKLTEVAGQTQDAARAAQEVSQQTGDQISNAIAEVRNPSPQTLRTRAQIDNLERQLEAVTGILATPPLPTTTTTPSQ